jgi:hypothetical protein
MTDSMKIHFEPLSVRLPTANIITKVAFCEVLFSSLANDNNFVISTNKYQYFINNNKMEIRNTNNPQPIKLGLWSEL